MTDKKTVDSRQFLLIQAASLNQNILVQSRTIEPAKGKHLFPYLLALSLSLQRIGLPFFGKKVS